MDRKHTFYHTWCDACGGPHWFMVIEDENGKQWIPQCSEPDLFSEFEEIKEEEKEESEN